MSTADPSAPIDLELTDALVRLHLTLPEGWSWQLIPPPSRVDREGKVAPRITARRAASDVELQVGAAHVPAGLVPAVVYWCSLYSLDVPEDAVPWGSQRAFISRAAPGAIQQVCLIWVGIADSAIELRIQTEDLTARDELIDWLRQHLLYEPIEIVEPASAEPWWKRAAKLRERGLLDEAIVVVKRDGDRAEALLVEADLHVERMHRAQAAGEVQVAREAWQSASACAYAYAASATSGGEGAARSIERDRFLARLGPEPV